MKIIQPIKIIGFSALLGIASVALAAPSSPVELQSKVQQEKTVVQEGVEKRVLTEAKSVVPGDRLRFTTSYRNSGSAPVAQFVVTNPIPSAVALAPDSAAELEVSVDGGKTWGRLATLLVADGKGGTRPAQSSDVSHIRWTLQVIQPGASGALTYNAIVR